ncbi:ciliogenesis-associated TTC17-interacting protein isoform X2 [Corvus moneduloides]|uniref:ciliogenesis-associated TTC17-interacting protein isoform X2 n=1 Tax=Corvus moneduloides TaxID=1196302 RepID=UPI0013623B77|nr:ciliogenesis-associated TTC17-interacting protein isoform X2 [Corvus moneduloides]
MEPPPESPRETPTMADTAAEFLSLIGLKELEWCLFAETLAVVAMGAPPRDKAEGQWWMAAQWAPYQGEGEPVQSCILVQTRFRGKQDGVPVSSTLKAYVTWQLETLEQEEQECLELRPHPTEKRTHVVSHQHGMTVSKTLQEGEAEPQCQSFCYSRAKLRGLLLEGASLLLLRVLARRHTMPPNLVFPAMDTEGNLCTSSYVSRQPGGPSALGIQRQAVGSAETEVFVIERAVHSSSGASTVWHSSFLPNGRLAQLMQIGSPVLMVLQDESILSKSGRFEPQLPFPKEPLDWEEDIQLYSWFLDRKDELQLSHAAYLQQHPEVRALLSDFLQALLFQQPHDPISFAAEFFAHQRPIGSPFASTGAASPVPSSPPANSK